MSPFPSSPRARRGIRLAACAAAVLAAVQCGSPNAPTPPPPPALSIGCTPAIDTQSPTGAPVPITYQAPLVTGGVPPVSTSCTVPSGTQFSVGNTSVLCTSTDSRGASASCSFSVTVRAPPQPPRLAQTSFVAFGDSITWGVDSSPVPALTALLFPTPPPFFAYPNQLRERLSARYAQPFTVLNAGIPGEYAANIPGQESGLRRFRDVLTTFRPEVVLLMEGTNDLLGRQNGADAAIGALELMLAEARLQNRRVFLATIPPQRANGLRNRGEVAALIPGFNARIRALATGNVVLVDVFAAMQNDVQTLIGLDDLHPTTRGFEVIADTFLAAIRANLEVANPALDR